MYLFIFFICIKVFLVQSLADSKYCYYLLFKINKLNINELFKTVYKLNYFVMLLSWTRH